MHLLSFGPGFDLQTTLERYARLFDLEEVGAQVGYPAFMKPYDGGGWVGVTKSENDDELKQAYEESGRFVMHVQKGVVPYDGFVRCIGMGPQTRKGFVTSEQRGIDETVQGSRDRRERL